MNPYCNFIYLLFLNFLSSLVRSHDFNNFPALANYLFANFDIDAFNHIEFFLDNDDTILEDEMVYVYSNLVTRFVRFNTVINIPSERITKKTQTEEKHYLPKYPILYYISIASRQKSKGVQLLQTQSSANLSTHIWVVEFSNVDCSGKSMRNISDELETLIPNLEFDSQVFVLFPLENSCDSFNIYEVYKVILDYCIITKLFYSTH